MNRRRLLQLGLGAGAVFAVAGATVALLPPAYEGGRLSPASRGLFAALAPVLLDGSLPTGAAAPQALSAHLGRLDATIAGLPRHVRDELGTLLQLLSTAPGRLLLAGTPSDLTVLSGAALAEVLSSMRRSGSELRQQTYHALRELTVGSYFADPSTWAALGYPGPVRL